MAEISNEMAKTLFFEGAILVCRDVPQGTEFVNNSGQTAPRTGFFQYFGQREIIVKKWDANIEDLVDQTLSAEEIERIRANLENLDSNLGKYPFESLKKWHSLSSHVTQDVMNNIQPVCNRISSLTEVKNEDVKQPVGTCDTMLRFTPLPFRHFPKDSTPAEITKLSMDKSQVLEDIISRSTAHTGILGELQLAFITFLVGQVYDAFEQWKNLIYLLCSCLDAIDKHPDIFEAFIRVLHFQLLEMPQDFLSTLYLGIISLLTIYMFFTNVQDSSVSTKLKRKAHKFKEYLTRHFQWNFDHEPEEDAPVIVEIA